MKAIHWVGVVVGSAAAAWGIRIVLSPAAPRDDTIVAAPASDGAAPGATRPRSQVQIMAGARPRDEETPAPVAGAMRSEAESEADRRRDGLREVLSKLEGAPVYVEGVDGPTPEPPPRRR